MKMLQIIDCNSLEINQENSMMEFILVKLQTIACSAQTATQL